jgi:flagellar export protein FliJ
MSSAYATLLAVREIEERQAELDFAESRRATSACEDALARARRTRDAWLDDLAAGGRSDGDPEVASLLIRLEDVERAAEARLAEATRRQAARREALRQAQQRRQAVENLHAAALEAERREAARRAQAELDDLAALGAARKETA